MHICIHTYVCAHPYICVFTDTCIHILICVYTFICVCIHILYKYTEREEGLFYLEKSNYDKFVNQKLSV